ncbi:nuclear RNA export factor 1-like [Asterias rubens]|uniref:nuclear RNA export factor 1-like n=1 Tax=Asterias rubens TaxID=7604 RepID=UPI001455AF50|nr:nuclear RNA export factor 1-like [Asterias rubens]
MSRGNNRKDNFRSGSGGGRDGGGRSQQFYGHDDRAQDDRRRDDGGNSNWRGGHSGSDGDNWRGGRGRRGGRGASSNRGGGRDNGGGGGSGGGSYGGKWRGGKGPRRGRGGGGGGGNDGGNNQGPNPRSRLQDDDGDVMMGDHDAGPSQRFNPYGRSNNNRRGGNRGRDRDNRSGSQNRSDGGSMSRLGLPINQGSRGGSGSRQSGRGKGALTWSKITIPHGRKVEKDWLLRSLQNICRVPFIPLEFHLEGEMAVFYVDDIETGNALRSLSGRITSKTGHKIIVVCRPSRPPNNKLDEDSVEAMKVCLSDRYDPSTKSLNLSQLIQDQGLKSKGVNNVLNRPQVMETVVMIISENIPEVLSIDLSNNKLYSLTIFSKLAEKATSLRSLNLAKNVMRGEADLENIKDFPLEDLILEDNPIVQRSNYTSIVRRCFPKMMRLDGKELPPPITFDLETPTVLPPVQHSFFGNEAIKKILDKFISQYFTVFDSGDRQQFIEIYHEQSCFSLTTQAVSGGPSYLKKYFSISRNLLRIKEPSQELRLFKHTKLSVVAFLNEMSPTLHDTNSFQVDLSLAQGNLVSFTVHGIFKEFNTSRSTSQLISFSRTFLAVMQPPTLCIINDHLSIRNPTQAQQKAAFISPAPTPTPSPVRVPPEAAHIASTLTSQHQEMIASFMKDSKMNIQFSTQCLSENNWDYSKAGEQFTKLHAEGKIPAEAFK